MARPRLRELGHSAGRFGPGPRNAIVDVPGVRVGHRTLVEGAAVRTGVTAVLAHGGDLYGEKVLGGCHVANGYGKATGLDQLRELGTIEAPILVTSTLSVGPVWEGGLRHVLAASPEAGRRNTVNVIVGDCFDGYISDARGLHVRPQHALEAIAAASEDEVGEGSVGAGTGTTCLGYKSGVGTASRVTLSEPAALLGCLVVANYGSRGDLHLLVEPEPGDALAEVDERGGEGPDAADGNPAEGGSIVVVVATDAPLSERQLGRLAARAALGIGRAAGYAANRSGDYAVAFSTAHRVAHRSDAVSDGFRFLRDDGATMRELFEAAAEVTYEAILNSLCVADTMEGRDGHRLEAFPHALLPRLRGL